MSYDEEKLTDLGNGVSAEWWTLTDPDNPDGPGIVGAIVEHHMCKTKDEKPYKGQGLIVIDPRLLKDVAHWTVMAGSIGSFEGLTLVPSILCQHCGLHGFIRDGKWVSA